MNYSEFKSLVDLRDKSPTERTLWKMSEQMIKLTEIIQRQQDAMLWMMKAINSNTERISQMGIDLNTMFPLLDEIECIADGDSELKAEMINRYINCNPDYEDDCQKYEPQMMIGNIAKSDPDYAQFLELEYADEGAIWLTKRYKEWEEKKTEA